MWYNSIMAFVLRSPLHGMLSKNTMLITYSGRKSGKAYTTPVNYIQVEDGLLVTSYRKRTWWRNLRGGASVTLRLQGKDRQATAEVYEDDENVTRYLAAYLSKAPQVAKYFNVSLDDKGEPNLADVRRAAGERVIIRVQLAG
jgi:deazaflavin-dependent oxidoreductase (nitroreductase family)